MTTTNPWHGYPVPAMRHEALYGDRMVRCFAERPVSFAALFDRALHDSPDQEAVVCEGQRWSYARTEAEARRLAAGFAAQGIGTGDRVLMLLSNRPEFVFVLLALQRLNAIAVPVGVREQKPGLAFIARVILYTSGTTGQPKGATLTHLAIVHSALHFQACMRLRAGDRSALAVPASHVTGLIAVIASMWQVAGVTVIVPMFKAEPFVALMAAEKITHTLMVPAMYQLCLLSEGFARHDLSAWRLGGYGGAPMPVATIDALAAALPGLTLLNTYGATETTSPTAMMPAGQTRDHVDSVGVALPAADVRVMDEQGCELPAGETGELWIAGPMVVPGYWANPEATAASFSAGYWRSGDLGSVDAQGYVRILDRKKDMLNRGGFKVYSVEVENVLMAWPGMVEAAVIGLPCPVLGERVHVVVHAPGAPSQDSQALRRHCARQLADYKVPETITWRAAPLPRNANGKVMKRLLRDEAAAAAAASSARAAAG
ncbi:MAG: AMP-binding protein [Burkholderiales bacterium]|nr:AMP-binding protein [Burkholderiales bacterium]